MVLKPKKSHEAHLNLMFYSSVILNGTETQELDIDIETLFYSSVILNGTKTTSIRPFCRFQFYSSVIIITMSFLV